MSADHDALIRMAQQLIATRLAMVRTLEALRREMEKRLGDSEARIDRTRRLLASSAALLQQSKTLGHKTDPRPRRDTAPVRRLHSALA